MRLQQTIPAMPVKSVASAVGFYRTDFGTREFHTLDVDGNLLTFFAPTPVTDADRDKDAIAAWSAMSVEAMAALDPEGDFGKQHLLNPTVFRMLGDVAGRRILDAGCGQGYFSRLLAARKAPVVALEPADGPYRYAVARRPSSGRALT